MKKSPDILSMSVVDCFTLILTWPRYINKGTIFMAREIGRVNRVAVLSRDKTDVSRGGEVNDRGKRMGD